MKRGLFIFVGVLIIFSTGLITSAGNTTIIGQTITGEAVTGKATDANFAMNVILTMGAPYLNISSPKNNTYISTNGPILNYTVLYADLVWYNLDNGINQTINSSFILNTSEGNHILFMYANNSDGNLISENVSFTVNSARLKILYSEFASSDKGESTDFNTTSYEDLQNLSNIILEKIYGKIKFNDNINVTDDENFSDFLVDLDANANISLNKIYLNSTALPNFNKPATLYLYGLSFTNPQILKDGTVCPDSICTKESYSSGTLKFNVTQFSTYSSQETQTGGTTVIITSGGGGGGIIEVLKPKIPSFKTDQETIKVSSVPGRVVTKKLTITNILNKSISLTLSQKDMQRFLILKETQITLNPGESKEISFDFMISSDVPPDLYLGKLIITDKDSYSFEAIIILEIVSEGAMLDVGVKIQPEYSKISAGQDMLAQISLFNVGTMTGKRDILLSYIIKNTNGKEILQYNETVSIETQTNLIKRFSIPAGTAAGKYVLYVKAITPEEKIASGSDTFQILNPLGDLYLLMGIVIALILMTLFFIIHFRRKQKKIMPTIISEHKEEQKEATPNYIFTPLREESAMERRRREIELANLRERIENKLKSPKKKISKRKSNKKKK
jgi:hypothetical protein